MSSRYRRLAPPETDPDPDELLRVTVEAAGSSAVVAADGEVDLHTAPLLSAALDEAFALDPDTVVLDFTGVTFLASSGLAVMVDALSEATRRRCALRLLAGSDAVLRPLEITGLSRLFL